MTQIARRVREIIDLGAGKLPVDELLGANEPVVIRGLVSEWPLTQAGLQSDRAAMEYMRSFYNGRVVNASVGAGDIQGRLFYNDDFTELNFSVERVKIDEFLSRIEAHTGDRAAPTMYIGSTIIDAVMPEFRERNDLDLAAAGVDAPPAIWIGNRTIASCHYDAPNNIACCVVGKRRFTLFPPDQIFNLYPGPLDPTPGGQAISLVDFANPDFERYPRFRSALEHGQVVEVGPGDAVFIPSMWWHHVQGLSAFNTLVNYWWSRTPAYVPTPMHALYHAIWSLRDRPESEKQAWQQVFDYYVFGPSERAGEHLPPTARGMLGPITDDQSRHIRAMLINKLNR
jgi:hypothetical protein